MSNSKDDKNKKDKDIKDAKNSKSGGFTFYLSLLSLLFIGAFNLKYLPSLQTEDSLNNWFRFAAGFFIGILIAQVFIIKKFSVACHELKHFIIATLVGNKFKELNVKDKSGHYTYSYTKKTAKFNALIALAPYWFPLIFIFTVFLAIPVYLYAPELAVSLIGIGIGADLLMNMRDISPCQTDLTHIRGGINVALAFIVGMNLTIWTFVAAWVSNGKEAFVNLAVHLWEVISYIATNCFNGQ